MIRVDRSLDADAFAVAPRSVGAETGRGQRALLAFGCESDIAGVFEQLRASAESRGLAEVRTEAFRSTGSYRSDPNRPQKFLSIAGAVQIDYREEQESDLLALLRETRIPMQPQSVTISVGSVVTCLEPSGSNLLLLGAQRKIGLTPERFGQYWSQTHAPHATKELKEAPVPIGYELFLVDHDLSASAEGDHWRAGDVDGWMHITTVGASDFARIAKNPEHRAWVLEDEANFVNFEAPLVGQQMQVLSAEQ